MSVLLLYPRTAKLLLGYIGFTLSVGPAFHVRSVTPTVFDGFFSY